MSEFKELLTDLKRKIYKPVYLLCGEEPYYIDQISDYIEKNVLDESEKEFNQMVIYGRETDTATIVSAAKRFPMMSEHQVIIVKEAQNLREFSKATDEEEGNSSKSSNNILASYLEQPTPSTILVICHKYKTVNKRSLISKAVLKKGIYFESKKLYDSKIPEWITGYCKEKNIPINPKAAQMLAEFLGNDLQKISNEIDKMLINVPKGTEIQTQHVQENIGISKDFNVFELQDALSKKDVLKANRIINYFASNPKDNPLVVVLSTLFGYFNKVLMYHFCADKNKFNVAKQLSINPYFVDDYERAARQYPTAKIKQIMSFLREADLKSKGVDNPSPNDGDLLKELIFKILH